MHPKIHLRSNFLQAHAMPHRHGPGLILALIIIRGCKAGTFSLFQAICRYILYGNDGSTVAVSGHHSLQIRSYKFYTQACPYYLHQSF